MTLTRRKPALGLRRRSKAAAGASRMKEKNNRRREDAEGRVKGRSFSGGFGLRQILLTHPGRRRQALRGGRSKKAKVMAADSAAPGTSG